jgi:hypothetical protein
VAGTLESLISDITRADQFRKITRAHSAPSPTAPHSSPPILDSISCQLAVITVDSADSLSALLIRHDVYLLPASRTVCDESLVSESAIPASRLFSHPPSSMMTNLVPDPSSVESVLSSRLLPLDPTPSSPQRKIHSLSPEPCLLPCSRRSSSKSPTISPLSSHGWILRVFFPCILSPPDRPVLFPRNLPRPLLFSALPLPRDGWLGNEVSSDRRPRWNEERVSSILSGYPWVLRTSLPDPALDEIVSSDELPMNNLPATSPPRSVPPTGPASNFFPSQLLDPICYTYIFIPCLYYSLATIDISC